MLGRRGEIRKSIAARVAVIWATAATIILVGAGTASAVTRYAAPGGTGDDTVCMSPAAAPCSINEAAAGNNVLSGDEVVIAPGSYSDTAGDLGPSSYVDPVANNVHGEAGKPRPIITLDADGAFGAFFVDTGNTLSHVGIDTSVSTTSISIQGGTVDDLTARSSTPGAIVCNHAPSVSTATIRDTACLSSGDNARTLGNFTFFPTGTAHTGVLRNVTVLATGMNSDAINYAASGSPGTGTTLSIDAKAVIARGSQFDVYAQGFSGASTTITLDHSNYAGTGTNGTGSVTSPFANNNQITAPTLAADGIHQLSGSPTINAGAVDGSSGALDIDGQLRSIDSTPDIGADELGHSTSTSVSCAPTSVQAGSDTTCTATVTDTASSGPTTPNGNVTFSSDTTGGSFGSGGSCALVIATATTASCQLTYTPGQVGSGTHQITGLYNGDTSHDSSQGSGSVLIIVAPAPAVAPPTTAPNPLCATLRKKLKAAKQRGDKAKVRKIRRKLRRLGC